MASKVVSNTGPIIHLSEISLINALNIFQQVLIPEEVRNELRENKIQIHNKLQIKFLKERFKDIATIFIDKFSLHMGEAQAIALALQERADFFLTDDLDARTVASVHNIEAHGTVGIILRAFREKIINKETAIRKVQEIYTKSSLFITRDLTDYIIKEINEFKRKSH